MKIIKLPKPAAGTHRNAKSLHLSFKLTWKSNMAEKWWAHGHWSMWIAMWNENDTAERGMYHRRLSWLYFGFKMKAAQWFLIFVVHTIYRRYKVGLSVSLTSSVPITKAAIGKSRHHHSWGVDTGEMAEWQQIFWRRSACFSRGTIAKANRWLAIDDIALNCCKTGRLRDEAALAGSASNQAESGMHGDLFCWLCLTRPIHLGDATGLKI